MTLVAAFPIHNVPVLLGDMLVTMNGAYGNPPRTLPSMVEDYIPPAKDFTVETLTSKLVILGQHCAIGWSCADVRTAASVMAKLRELARLNNLTLDAIGQAIDENPRTDDDLLSIVGCMFMGDRFEYFSYEARSIRAEGIERFGSGAVAGSGSSKFMDLLKVLEFPEPSVDEAMLPRNVWNASHDHSLRFYSASLHLLGALIAAEHRQGSAASTLSSRFGGAYELVYFDGARFSFLSDYSIQTWHAFVDAGPARVKLLPTLIQEIYYVRDNLVIDSFSLVVRGTNLEPRAIRFVIPAHNDVAVHSNVHSVVPVDRKINYQLHSILVFKGPSFAAEHKFLFTAFGPQQGPASRIKNMEGSPELWVDPEIVRLVTEACEGSLPQSGIRYGF